MLTNAFKEDIPYLEWTYLPQLMVQTLNETAIYHMEILTHNTRWHQKRL